MNIIHDLVPDVLTIGIFIYLGYYIRAGVKGGKPWHHGLLFFLAVTLLFIATDPISI